MALTPTEDSLSLVNLLDAILEQTITGFTDHGVDLPERRYWTTSQPAADCEQVVVFFNQAYIGPPGDEASLPQRCHAPRTAQIDIQVLRCIPVPVGPRAKMPPPESLQEASHRQAIDAWVLLDLACSFDMWNGSAGAGGLGVIATVDTGEPQGGFQGPTLHLTVAIP